ncbi:hypothetical protein UVI_02064020 [Ustilaginoidea virens]|uniref:DNA polymerase delta subunit 3 n=1 Tax=Ustilaginoidea virens TaxID=1159556 RepID=A0A1B5L7X8_USTVR|nr:hypothetical protein UVI_02064020 [Ustilaginoidea virens]
MSISSFSQTGCLARYWTDTKKVTYRGLSRALQIHVNTAKGNVATALFDFHRYQNARDADSIHATYLVCGLPAASARLDDGIETRSSLQGPEESSGGVKASKVILVEEQNLQEALMLYESVTSIHIYGLSPNRAEDSWIRSDSGQKTCGQRPNREKPNTAFGKYGTIGNPKVQHRDQKLKALSTTPPASIGVDPVIRQEKIKREIISGPSMSEKPPCITEKVASAHSKKRAASNNIIRSFAKAAAASQTTETDPAKRQDDAAMTLSDDGEADDSDFLPRKPEPRSACHTQSRTEREEGLRRMMDEDDDDEDDDDNSDAVAGPLVDDDLSEGPKLELNSQPSTQEKRDSPEIILSTGNGRRRGRRRVIAKKRIVDDEGYMVTIQESTWESFSEDDSKESASQKATPLPKPSSAASKPKKSSGKGAQGSIMSFFAKK